jgi:predicted nucleic acid-binding protein
VIFVDTNVFMYAVGRPHPLRADAQAFFRDATAQGRRLVTSAEVLQELVHAYLPVGRVEVLDVAWRLATSVDDVWPLEIEDVAQARALATRHPGLGARDLVHLACCTRHGALALKTYDRSLAAAWKDRHRSPRRSSGT